MKKVISAILVCVLALCLAGCKFGVAGLTVYGIYTNAGKYSVGNFTYDAQDVKKVKINWVDGEIEIVQSESTTLSVAESGGSLKSDEQMRYYIKNGKLTIQYCKSAHIGEIDGEKKKLRVEIPAGIDVDIDNSAANVNVGTVSVGDFDATCVSGSVNFASITADEIDIEVATGSVNADSVFANEFSVKGVSGNINVQNISADEIDVKIVSGKTTLGLAKVCEVKVSGVGGDVSIALPSGAGAKVKFESVGGSIKTDLPYTKDGKIYTFGAGDVEMDIETVGGSLYIK